MKFMVELSSSRLWIEVFAEFLITSLFLSYICGCSLSWDPPVTIMHISLSCGLGVATFAMTMWEVSSGLFNPAITIAFLIGKKKTLVQTVLYIVAQLVGAICGAAMVYGVAPDKAVNDSVLAVNIRNPDVTVGKALAVEIWISFILVLVVFAVGDPDRKLTGYGPPLAIGITVFVNLNLAIPLSGGSMNPARSFGPAVVMNSWQDHWIYWTGPIIGGSLAALVYHYIFAQRIIKKIGKDTYDLEHPGIELSAHAFSNEQHDENPIKRENNRDLSRTVAK